MQIKNTKESYRAFFNNTNYGFLKRMRAKNIFRIYFLKG
jgi:hypothetical protein